MAKYSTKFKCKLVGRYLEGKESYEFLANIFNIPDIKLIRVWVNEYRTLGYDVLKNLFKLYLTEEWSYQAYKSYGHLKQSICTYIKYYNEERIKEKLGYLSPVEYRKKNAA